MAAAVLLALMIAEFPLAGLAHQTVDAGGGGAPLWFSVPFAVIGFLVAYRKPGNRLRLHRERHHPPRHPR